VTTSPLSVAPPSSQPLYERWPYPNVPLVASLSRPQVWQLHLDWLRSEAGLDPAPPRPHIWVAGCGAWQAYPVAMANPGAEILATDISEASLARTRRRLAVQGVTNVTVDPGDLNDPASFPAGRFDWIECFGVLMNLQDPAATLRAFAQHLNPGGLIRLMVYPWFGRRRVLQVARIARLLGLGWNDARHPRWLGTLMRSLPSDHPLRFTFEDYADSANLAGVVDGFLHVSDVAFSAFEMARMVDAAGLELAFVVHRPWGDPWVMGPRLGLGWDPWALLYWLDLWQELKSNLVLVLRRKGDGGGAPRRLHPLLDPDAPVNWADSLRLLGGRAVGLSIQDRRASSGWLRLSRAEYEAHVERSRRGELRVSDPLAIFGARELRRPARGFPFPDEAEWRRPRLYRGAAVPHPAWDHQLRAFSFASTAGLGEDEAAIAAWNGHGRPLEDAQTPYGFSPHATLAAHGARVRHWRSASLEEVPSWNDLRLTDEDAAFALVHDWAARVDPSLGRGDDATLRELFALTFGYRQLAVDTAAR